MAWIHVEDSKPPSNGTFVSNKVDRRSGFRSTETSSQTFAHSIYRCYQCRALWVSKIGNKPDCACGKCGAKP
jgi:hypothetical protein